MPLSKAQKCLLKKILKEFEDCLLNLPIKTCPEVFLQNTSVHILLSQRDTLRNSVTRQECEHDRRGIITLTGGKQTISTRHHSSACVTRAATNRGQQDALPRPPALAQSAIVLLRNICGICPQICVREHKRAAESARRSRAPARGRLSLSAGGRGWPSRLGRGRG